MKKEEKKDKKKEEVKEVVKGVITPITHSYGRDDLDELRDKVNQLIACVDNLS